MNGVDACRISREVLRNKLRFMMSPMVGARVGQETVAAAAFLYVFFNK